MGAALDSMDWLFLDRDWESDKKLMIHRCKSWTEDKYKLWLFIFPEGTDFAEDKRLKSVKVIMSGSQKLLFVPCVKSNRPLPHSLRKITAWNTTSIYWYRGLPGLLPAFQRCGIT